MTSGLLLIPLILALAADTFTVGASIGVSGLPRNFQRRFVIACATAEGAMPILGFEVGGVIAGVVPVARWVAIALLAAVGVWMIREGLEGGMRLENASNRRRVASFCPELAAC